jgi:hypothetical protein
MSWKSAALQALQRDMASPLSNLPQEIVGDKKG